jgi:hypothetical protein
MKQGSEISTNPPPLSSKRGRLHHPPLKMSALSVVINQAPRRWTWWSRLVPHAAAGWRSQSPSTDVIIHVRSLILGLNPLSLSPSLTQNASPRFSWMEGVSSTSYTLRPSMPSESHAPCCAQRCANSWHHARLWCHPAQTNHSSHHVWGLF